MKYSDALNAFVVMSRLNECGQDLYEILKNFIVFMIQEKNIRCFSSLEIVDSLKSEFGLNAPILVVEKILKKLKKQGSVAFDKSSKTYCICGDFTLQKYSHIALLLSEAEDEEKKFFNKLSAYIVQDNPSCNNIKNIKEIFIKCLNGNFSDNSVIEKKIMAYMIKNYEDPLLNKIADGFMIFNALRYENTYSEQKWDKTLNVFLNMEIIFHLMGYNGIVFSQATQELMDLIRDINKRKPTSIKLYYMSETKEEIIEFFNITKKTQVPRTPAMCEIKKRGKDDRGIDYELANLWKFLDDHYITEKKLPINYNKKEDQEKSLVSQEDIKNFKHIEKHEKILDLLNKIAILRDENLTSKIENIGYIFLTDDGDTNFIAQKIIAEKYTIPLAVKMEYLANVLWLKLGRGFSKGLCEMPLLSIPATKMRIAICANENRKIDFIYRDLINDSSRFQDEKNLKKLVYELSSKVLKPEDIRPESVDDLLESYSFEDKDSYIALQQQKEKEYTRLQVENEENCKKLTRLKEARFEDILEKQNVILDKEKYLNLFQKKIFFYIGWLIFCVIALMLPVDFVERFLPEVVQSQINKYFQSESALFVLIKGIYMCLFSVIPKIISLVLKKIKTEIRFKAKKIKKEEIKKISQEFNNGNICVTLREYNYFVKQLKRGSK